MNTKVVPAPVSFPDDTAVMRLFIHATTEESKVFTERTTVLKGEPPPEVPVCLSPYLATRADMDRYVRAVAALVQAGWPAAWAVQEADDSAAVDRIDSLLATQTGIDTLSGEPAFVVDLGRWITLYYLMG